MLFKVSFLLLGIWLLGVLGVYSAGKTIHIFLLVGLMLLFLALLKARDAAEAARRQAPGGSHPR